MPGSGRNRQAFIAYRRRALGFTFLLPESTLLANA
jgi:hypothetical protein